MNCLDVRDRLAERALGALPVRDAATIDRHLQWCAACRKEAAELDGAATVLAYSVVPATPDPGLEARVTSAVRAAAVPRAVAPSRRGRLAVTAAVAAMVAVAGLGWGAVMAGRLARSEAAVKDSTRRQQDVAARYIAAVEGMPFNDPQGEVFLATVAPAGVKGFRSGGGSAFTLVSPSLIDQAVVMVTNLPASSRAMLPFTVRLTGPNRTSLTVGRIRELDTGGAAMITRQFNRDLSAYAKVVIEGGDGRQVLMRGTLTRRADLASPAP